MPRKRSADGAAPGRVREIIGRTALTTPLWKTTYKEAFDATQCDYEFWDRLRHGLSTGYELGALFCKPLTQMLAAYTVGSGFEFALVDPPAVPHRTILQPVRPDARHSDPIAYTNDLLLRWSRSIRVMVARVVEDLYALGDQYIVVNPDGSLSVFSPETAEVITDPPGSDQIVGYKFVVRYKNMVVTSQYTAEKRDVTIQSTGAGATQTQRQSWPNLIGRLPVVHLACDCGPNELYGRPVYYSLLKLFSRYDDLLNKALDGAEVLGNPIPKFFGLEDINEGFINLNDTIEAEEYTDREGNEETRTVTKFDRNAVLVIGKGGDFDFASPDPNFPEAVRSMLKSLFFLILDHTRVPEFIWGGAIASSKASAEAQLPPFARYIEHRRAQLEGEAFADDGAPPSGGLLELADIWLRTKALADPKVYVGAVKVKWPDVTQVDEALRLEWVKLLAGLGLITEESAVAQAPFVDNPALEVEMAQAQRDARRAARQDSPDDAQARLRGAENLAGKKTPPEADGTANDGADAR